MKKTDKAEKNQKVNADDYQGKRYGKLSRRVVIGMLMLGVVLIIAVGVAVGGIIKDAVDDQYCQLAHSYGKMVVDCIDGDRIRGYLETGQTDEHYREVEELMDIIEQESPLKYLYVCVPDGNELVYVWDADIGDGMRDTLGSRVAMKREDLYLLERVYNNNPVEELEFFPEEDLAVAFVPVYDSTDTPVAIVGADFPMEGIQRTYLTFMYSILINILVVFVSFMLVYYFAIQKRIVDPIRSLSRAASQMKTRLDVADGAFKADIHTGDEIEELGDSFERMDVELREYLNKVKTITADREKIGAELSVAEKIQANMLPMKFPAFPDRKDFDLYAAMYPAKEVGGDFYDFFLIDDDHLGLVIADVSDKGVPAALFMAVSKTLIHNQMIRGDAPNETLMHVNNELMESEENEMFVTVWAGILTISTGELVCANAGHEYPVIGKAGREYELRKTKHGTPLGIYEGVKYENETFFLEHGDLLFVYTDGLPEATDPYQELFGNDRMIEALNRFGNIPPRDILIRLKQETDHFVDGRDPFDDLTMLAVKLM
ncbi:MAG: SpoIIE family protein phosphatase [Lachnospiraceae bacterium]|nr:SpoIIE family protein phosphatase [Lachnospiraceae bacterium]